MLTEVCDDFAIDAAQGQWVTTIYMLTMGVTVPVVTYLARRFSLKRLVYLALGLFLAGSAVIYSPELRRAHAGRVLQAIATGITLPLVQSVAMTRFPRERTGTTMGIGALPWGSPPTSGRIIGGALVDSWGWRSFYGLLIGILVLLALACALVRARATAMARRRCVGRTVAGAFHARFRRPALGGLERGNMPLSARACGFRR